MAHQPNPNDPYRGDLADDDLERQARLNRLDNELQADPELAEGPASSGKVMMFAIAIAAVLGAVFYGLNNTTINQAGTSTTAQNSQAQNAPVSSPPAAPPGMRDVTPRANSQPGTTTGAAPPRPASPAPADSNMNRMANPPTDNTAPSK